MWGSAAPRKLAPWWRPLCSGEVFVQDHARTAAVLEGSAPAPRPYSRLSRTGAQDSASSLRAVHRCADGTPSRTRPGDMPVAPRKRRSIAYARRARQQSRLSQHFHNSRACSKRQQLMQQRSEPIEDSGVTEVWRELSRVRSHVAWLGETPRMAFWQTDALTADAGGAMLEHILSRTSKWAAIQISCASAALVEARRVTVPGAVTLFRLLPHTEYALSTWLRVQKRSAAAHDGIVPSDAAFVTVSDAFSAWKLLPAKVVQLAKNSRVIHGAESVSMGTVKAADMTTANGLLSAVQLLAAGYLHSTPAVPVVPFLELQ